MRTSSVDILFDQLDQYRGEMKAMGQKTPVGEAFELARQKFDRNRAISIALAEKRRKPWERGRR